MAVVALCTTGSAEAQSFNFGGLLTAHVGVAGTNAVRDAAATPGASLAVLDDNGIGLEIDLGHLNDFDSTIFAESRITSLMFNVMAMRGPAVLRPFVAVGAGVMRVSGTVAQGLPSVGRTEAGWNAGGGVLYMLNEVVGVRGDARYFRHFSRHADIPLAGDGVLDFWRTSIGVTLAWPIR